mmetsp:Transcript_10690/g.33843  ORF Transcript_10690/g.33843 Transcript_10690/m.33843 type:complete len:255 (+) Transcript_10690:823-1587(+)
MEPVRHPHRRHLLDRDRHGADRRRNAGVEHPHHPHGEGRARPAGRPDHAPLPLIEDPHRLRGEHLEVSVLDPFLVGDYFVCLWDSLRLGYDTARAGAGRCPYCRTGGVFWHRRALRLHPLPDHLRGGELVRRGAATCGAPWYVAGILPRILRLHILCCAERRDGCILPDGHREREQGHGNGCARADGCKGAVCQAVAQHFQSHQHQQFRQDHAAGAGAMHARRKVAGLLRVHRSLLRRRIFALQALGPSRDACA